MSASERLRTRQESPLGRSRTPEPSPRDSKPLLLHLQQAAGNRAVLRLRDHGLLQARLTVGPADDPYEREADRVAAQVVGWLDGSTTQSQLGAIAPATVQRQEEEEELILPRRAGIPVLQRQEDDELLLLRRTGLPVVQRQSEQDEEEELIMPRRSGIPAVQRQEEEEELIMASTAGPGLEGGVAPDSVASQLEAARGGGQPLGASLRSAFERAFEQGFGGVRVHIDATADQTARALNADAFTTERDIYFRAGHYQPESAAGRFLLAHELTHVVQQGAAEGLPDADKS